MGLSAIDRVEKSESIENCGNELFVFCFFMAFVDNEGNSDIFSILVISLSRAWSSTVCV